MNDSVLEELVRAATGDTATLGLILNGSRGAGCADAESDYDLQWVLTDAAYEQRKQRGNSLHTKTFTHGRPLLDLNHTCPQELARIAAQHGWETSGFTAARVLLDKTGDVTATLHAIVTVPEEQARAEAAGWFDAYLNALYRSLKAWRRQNELGGRLQAAESAMHLVRTLFALARRCPPYHDRLAAQLDVLVEQGWPRGYLHATLLTMLRTCDPLVQQELASRVVVLLRDRGFGDVINAWDGEIERVLAFRFE